MKKAKLIHLEEKHIEILSSYAKIYNTNFKRLAESLLERMVEVCNKEMNELKTKTN